MSSPIDDYLLLTIYICCLCAGIAHISRQRPSYVRMCECRPQIACSAPRFSPVVLAQTIEPDCRLKCRSRHTGRMRVGRAWIQGFRDVAGGTEHVEWVWVWPLRAEHFVLHNEAIIF